MTLGIDRELAGYLLSSLEDLELPLLAWGVTDGALSEDEVLEAIDGAVADSPGAAGSAAARDIRDFLQDRALLFRVPGSTPPRYRTRLAETLRLTVQLRQLFPPRGSSGGPRPDWWQSGRRLIADYRLHSAIRKYPRWDIPAADALAAFAHARGWGQLQEAVTSAQIGSRSLAQFQVDATLSIFSSLMGRQSRGVIIGAGTSSGKTLAFYLPAFAAIAENARAEIAHVHTLAIYPRRELLRDQLRDAMLSARRIENVLRQDGRRPVRIGALYADTPTSSGALDQRGKASLRGWIRRHDGFICPYLTCPHCAAGDAGELLWPDEDRKSGSERLTCLKCHTSLPDGCIALTRPSMQARPPDLLFTTTEMLNRNSANAGLGRLMGWTGENPPSLVLLDEVHTYSGLHGAQVALLLRRWRHAAKKPATIVGLSATLRDAERFFSELTGLSPSQVDYITPAAECMKEEGREYAIALRADPVAGASLLSASIQAAMLFGRTLDPPGKPFLFGTTGFLFTDDLDVTNRFYDDLRDAEGGQSRSGQPGRKPVLADLRSPDLPQQADRYRDGQSWDLVNKIGRYLAPDLHAGELRIGRTSSQDSGVDPDADLVVATASLEVGFNDPRVGLVLQHKAPHDIAGFIQRRGRAGRTRGTRPVTVIMLSDYGRDRLAYQGYEGLFAPELTTRRLPVTNRYVLKIHAAQALLDWLGRDIRRTHRSADPRRLLTAPAGSGSRREDNDPRRWLADRLHELFTSRSTQDDLARYLQAALQVSADEAQALLWEQPRSLLLAVAPTALRRLSSNWRPIRNDPGATSGAMLPEFVTRALFDPLNVPELEFDLPFDTGEEVERLPISRALREAVPGRVSRRYGYKRDEHRAWIPLPDVSHQTIELDDRLILGARLAGRWHPYGHNEDGIDVLRPYRIRLEAPPPDVSDSSQGSPRWGTQIVVPEERPLSDADVPDPSPWRSRIISVGFASHAAGNPIEVRRMTTGADCDTVFKQRSERRTVRYTLDGRPAALGFDLDVDAMRVEIEPLDMSSPSVRRYLSSPPWRWQAFFRTVTADPNLSEVANTFQRDWLALIYITAFSLAGLSGRSPSDVRAVLADGSWRADLQEVLRVLYRDGAQAPGQGSGSADRLVARLTDLSNNSAVVAALDRAGQLLVAPDIADRTADLAGRAYHDTLAAAILAVALRACPDAQDDDLIVDVIPKGDSADRETIWLSETSIGGLGIIEHLIRYYVEDPRRFWTLVAGAQQPNEYEHTDRALSRLLRHVVQEAPQGSAAVAMAELRRAHSAADADRALSNLRTAWGELDGFPRHGAVAALATRVMRPGSSTETDAMSLGLIDEWTALEQQLGFEIDARVIAYATGSGRLQVGAGQPLSADQAFSMLWPRGAQARNHHLQHYQPYAAATRPIVLDRLLLEAAYDEQVPQIQVTEPGWEQHYQEAIAQAGAVDLVCPATERQSLSAALARIPALPVDRDVLRVYGDVSGVARYGPEFRARAELREALQ
jgi:ATP-dependent helicase Lhr and Lhr-like helicase